MVIQLIKTFFGQFTYVFLPPLLILFCFLLECGQEAGLSLSENSLYKDPLQKYLNDHNAVITQPEPDILECEVKWPLGSITMNKTRGGDGIPAKLFQILKDDAVKVLHSICQQIWKTSSGCRSRKGQFSFQSQRKAMPKNVQTTTQLHSSHILAK